MNKKDFKFVFFGTPEVALETLEILKENDYLPFLIVTAPDAKRGRGLKMKASPVASFAEKNNIPCLKPEKLDAEFIQKLKPSYLEPNCLSLVVAYGKILPEELIKAPRLGSINIHYSLLPKYRGASPVESAILNDDIETGVTIQQMEFKMDSGPILTQEKVTIGRDERAPELRERLIKIGGELLVKTMPDLLENKISPVVQDETQATYCKKIQKENGSIDFNDNPIKNYNKFRAYAHWPRTYFFKNEKRIIITDAELKDNKFIIKKVIPEGGKETNYKS